MGLLLYPVLRVLHLVYFIASLFSACWHYLLWSNPFPLQSTRRRIPRHLAVLLVPDSGHAPSATRECLLECVERTTGWCRLVGVEKLTVYESQGLLTECVAQISKRASDACEPNGCDSESGSDVEYPLTPPSSDYSDSRPLSPQDSLHKETSVVTIRLPQSARKRASKYGLKKRHSGAQKPEALRNPLTLCIASRQSSKPAVAAAATSLARVHARDETQPNLSVDMLNSILEGPHSVSAPDFLIVHHLRPTGHRFPPLELHNFPPWQIRLTEIHHCRPNGPLLERIKSLISKMPEKGPQALTEIDFRKALDEFAGAEMRFGR